MSEKEYLQESSALIAHQFEIEGYNPNAEYTKEEIINVLADRVAYFMEFKFEQLLSLMYTMDIKEEKVSLAMSPLQESPSNVALAHLILERHLQRITTKNLYKPTSTGDWWDF